MKNSKLFYNNVFFIVSIIIFIILFFPFYWIIITSLKTEQEIFTFPPTFFPRVLNIDSYRVQIGGGDITIIGQSDFNMFHSFGNSIVISFGALCISVLLAVPASYGIARYTFKGKNISRSRAFTIFKQ